MTPYDPRLQARNRDNYAAVSLASFERAVKSDHYAMRGRERPQPPSQQARINVGTFSDGRSGLVVQSYSYEFGLAVLFTLEVEQNLIRVFEKPRESRTSPQHVPSGPCWIAPDVSYKARSFNSQHRKSHTPTHSSLYSQ